MEVAAEKATPTISLAYIEFVADHCTIIHPWSSEEPSSLSSRAYNSLSSLEPIPSQFPVATHSNFVTRPGPVGLLTCYSDTAKQRLGAPQSANRTRHAAQAIWTQRPLLQRPLVAPPPQPSLPLRPCRALRMYMACPCLHTIQLPQVVANAP